MRLCFKVKVKSGLNSKKKNQLDFNFKEFRITHDEMVLDYTRIY